MRNILLFILALAITGCGRSFKNGELVSPEFSTYGAYGEYNYTLMHKIVYDNSREKMSNGIRAGLFRNVYKGEKFRVVGTYKDAVIVLDHGRHLYINKEDFEENDARKRRERNRNKFMNDL